MNLTYKAGIAGAVAAGLTLASAPASAEFYVGGSIGDGTIETSERFDEGSFNFEESDFAYKVFGGYMFSEYLGVELSYFDLGSPSQNFGFDGGETSGTVSVDLKAEVTGFAAQGIAAYPFGPFEVFGKLGLLQYDAEVEAKERGTGTRLTIDDSDVGLAYGIGGKYNINNFALRAEYEILDVDDIEDVYVWTFGAELSF